MKRKEGREDGRVEALPPGPLGGHSMILSPLIFALKRGNTMIRAISAIYTLLSLWYFTAA